MDLGLLISVTGLKSPDFVAGAKLAKEMGYTHVELGACRPFGGSDVADLGGTASEDAREIVAEIRDLDLEVSALQCHVDYLSSNLQEVRTRIDHTKHVLDLAVAVDVEFVHTVSGPLPEGMSADEGYACLVEAYQELLEHAADADVRLGIEPVFVYHIGNLATTKALFERLGRDDLFVNFDPSHFPYHREDPVPFIRAYGKRILHAHSKDATVTPLNAEDVAAGRAWDMGGGEQFAFTPPGRGVLDWPAILRALDEVGYQGVLSLELGHGIPDEEQAAREALEYLRPLLPS